MNDNIKLPLITEDNQEFLQSAPNTSDIIEWVQTYAREAVRMNSQKPLTDDQIEDIADDVGYACVLDYGNLGREVIWYDGNLSSFARAIEQAHGIGVNND